MKLNIGTLVILAVIALVLYFYTKCDRSENYSSIVHMDIPGYDLPQMPLTNKNEDECAQACDDNSECMWYNYNRNNRNCYLKKGVAKPDFVTGANIRRTDPVIVGSGYDIPGFDMPNMPIGAENENICAEQCRKNKCTFWNYNKKSKQCWLKHGNPTTNAMTGFKNIPDAEMSDEQIRSLGYIMPDECQSCEICPESPECPECEICDYDGLIKETDCPECQECDECEECTPEKKCPKCKKCKKCEKSRRKRSSKKKSKKCKKCLNKCCKGKCRKLKGSKKKKCLKKCKKGTSKKGKQCSKKCSKKCKSKKNSKRKSKNNNKK